MSLLHHNHDPETRLKESHTGCYLQICALNRIDKNKLLELIEETSDDVDTSNFAQALVQLVQKSSHFYYFDRPFYLNPPSSLIDVDKESVENLWIERTVLVQDELALHYEPLTAFDEIQTSFKLMLNPIRNAISDINEKTKELKHFVVQFTTNLNGGLNSTSLNTIHSLQPLTMRLLGCLDARVNGGLIKYVRELLTSEQTRKKKKKSLLHQLYLSIKDQLNVLESGLSIHDRILRDVEIKFSKDLAEFGNETFTETSATASSTNKYQKNYVEHIKHMNELNKHLIECLKLVTLELNERWAKFC